MDLKSINPLRYLFVTQVDISQVENYRHVTKTN